MSLRNLIKPGMGLVAAGLVIGALGFWGTQNVLHATSSDAFCMTCHSNHSLKDEVMASAHGNNAMGITVQCQDCHLPPGQIDYLVRKIIVSKDIIGYLTIDGFNTQEWLDENRKQQADLALKYFRSNDSISCRTCHTNVYENQPEAMSKMAKRMHTRNFEKAAEDRKTCVDCHKGVAHPYPR
ncbi:NapC/NirT family cytochrome c [Ferrimonas senticii]|uniref:NapC/NirT family cytochrome c n=1 Tax=Ferrimonas senticii TaxID=394566 RepID=UPI000486F88C|nr:NapC/NirT family cytochrome c [Ferrimonas senticii]